MVHRQHEGSAAETPLPGVVAKDAQDMPSLVLGRQRTGLLCALRTAVHFGGTAIAEPKGRMRAKWGSCSVVSSSGVLRAHSYGAAIDRADLVIRFNDAPTQGFEAMVGVRDDMRIVNDQFLPRSMWKVRTQRDLEVLLKHGGRYAVSKDTSYLVVPMAPVSAYVEEFSDAHANNDLYVLDEDMHNAIGRLFQQVYDPSWFSPNSTDGKSFIPTTGSVGMLVALSICDEVRAYGLAASAGANAAPYSYFDADAPKDKADLWHKTFHAEKDFWRRVALNRPSDVDATDIAVVPGFSQISCTAGRS